MNKKYEWHELIERNKHFHGNLELKDEEIIGNAEFSQNLYNLKNYILRILDDGNFSDHQHILHIVFSNIYDFIIGQDYTFDIFDISTNFYSHIYDALFFTSLGMFLHDTKRIRGKTLTEFIYDNSSQNYNKESSINYCTLKDPLPDLMLDKTTFRKSRHRLLSSRPVFTDRSEWSAISKDSEYEWSLKYLLERDTDSIFDTYKRIGNLYNDIFKELDSAKTSTDSKRLKDAYTKFLSKLRKIKYENYVNLQKFYLSYICNDKTYYGINIYRYEKENRFYIISKEIKKLTACKCEDEEDAILKKSSILSDIWFPRIYEAFFLVPIHRLKYTTDIFTIFRNVFIFVSRLIIDELVEKEYFGDKWESSFISIMNEMTEKVFYNPHELDFSFPTSVRTEELFQKLLSQSVRDTILKQTGISVD